MINKKVIGLIMCLALSSSLLTGMVVTGNTGLGSAEVANAIPSSSVDILDITWTSVGTVLPNALFYYNVTVNDPDGFGDIQNVTLEIKYDATTPINNPEIYYRFAYNDTLGQWFQMNPSTGNYLNTLQSSIFPINATTGIFSFAVTVNKTAMDTNGLNDWGAVARIRDYSGSYISSPYRYFIMGPFVELTLIGNAGGSDFHWIGEAESNVTIQFYTVVTSNDQFDLNCSYTGFFDAGFAPWGSPVMWVKQILQTNATLIPNATAAPGTNATWYTSSDITFYDYNRTHQIALFFPPGITKGVTYTGVTIWIQARNT